MTDGYGVAASELTSHANNVRDEVGSKVASAHEAAQYEPAVTDMGILGFVITQLIDTQNATDRMIMLAKDFGDDLTDRVEHAGRTYEDVEQDNLEILDEIDRMIERAERRENMPNYRPT